MSRKLKRLFTVFAMLASLSGLANFLTPTRVSLALKPPMPTKMAESTLKVGALSELKGDKTYNNTGGILVYAETKSYRVYICADRKNKTQPRYYRSRDRNGNSSLNLEAKGYNPQQMRYFQFKNNGYAYLLQMPTGQIPQPELTVLSPEETPLLREKITRYLARP